MQPTGLFGRLLSIFKPLQGLDVEVEEPQTEQIFDVNESVKRLPRQLVSQDVFDKLIDLYNRRASEDEFRMDIELSTTLESIISSMNMVSLRILDESAFSVIQHRQEQLIDWINYLKLLNHQGYYNESIGYAVGCLLKCQIGQLIEGHFAESQFRYQQLFGQTYQSKLSQISRMLKLIEDYDFFVQILKLSNQIRIEYQLQRVIWWGSRKLIQIVWSKISTERQLTLDPVQIILEELNFDRYNEYNLFLRSITDGLFNRGYSGREIGSLLYDCEFYTDLIDLYLVDDKDSYGFLNICQLLETHKLYIDYLIEQAVVCKRMNRPYFNLIDKLVAFSDQRFFSEILERLGKYPKLQYFIAYKIDSFLQQRIDKDKNLHPWLQFLSKY